MIAFALGISMLMTGCFGDRELRCENVERYAASRSVPPVRVPDDLDVPDESDALQIPSGDAIEVPDPETITECLEGPPDFFDEDQADN